MVAVTWRRHSPNSAAARIHCTAQTVLCTVYVIIQMCSSYHISIYIQSSCSYSKHTWRNECCRFSFVMAMQQQFQVMCFKILDFYHRCYQGETMSGTGWLLLKDSKLQDKLDKKKLKNSSRYYAYITTIKSEYTDKPHSDEHYQTVPHITWKLSSWILDSITWGFRRHENLVIQ